MLQSVEQVADRIAQGEPLLLAGSESLLRQLPAGKWIGGTIPYFMDRRGGICTESRIFVTEVPESAVEVRIQEYRESELPRICKDAPENGYSFIVIPSGSAVHREYAEHAPGYEGMFSKPVVGWISGVHLSQVGKQSPLVFVGAASKALSQSAAVMHITLPAAEIAHIEIVNVFEQGTGDVITFPEASFEAQQCMVNRKPTKLGPYLMEVRHDLRVPLVADYNGTPVNVALQSVGCDGTVRFYAPVFPGVEYRLGKSVANYVAAFESAVRGRNLQPTFSCNCILNYLYAELEGKRTGNITGPMTFGEIAHQLLNQTLVSLQIRNSREGCDSQVSQRHSRE